MTREKQDKLWAELSEEERNDKFNKYREYKNIINDKEYKGNKMFHTGFISACNDIFGEHNFKPKDRTYKEVAEELFKNGAWQIDEDYVDSKIVHNEIITSIDGFNCTSERQVQKLKSINMLLNVAKFLNKNEHGDDWVPDFKNSTEAKWSIAINKENKPEPKLFIYSNSNCSVVYFRTKELIEQAVQILGEDVVRTALTTEY